MSNVFNFNSWVAINEQEQTGFSCDIAWYKDDQLNIESFGKILSCGKGFVSAYNFWNTSSDENKQYILDTLKQGNPNMVKFGLATGQAGQKQASKMPNSYRINGAIFNEVIRGDKDGTFGFYLDKDNNIYIKNSVETIQAGANDVNELISKLNVINKNRYINHKPQIKINPAATLASLKNDEKDEGVYKGYQYQLDEDTQFKGFIFYPALPKPFKKIVGYKTATEKADLPPFKSAMKDNFKDNSTEAFPEFLDEVRSYFTKIFNDRAYTTTITDIRIESGASNKRTTYPDPKEKGTYSYAKNTKLAEDRGNSLYELLKKEFGDKIPEMKTPVKAVVQECGGDGEAGICPIAPEESAKFLNIYIEGHKTRPVEYPMTTNHVSYQYTHWYVSQM